MVSAPRQFAARFLHDQARPGDFAEHRLERDPGFTALLPVDRRLAQELILGILRWRATLDWLIAQRTDGRPQKPTLQNLLRLGLYQLFWLDRIPDHAAVNDTVTLARELGFGPQSGFINALLRGFARDRDATRRRLLELRQTDPAAGWSFPRWLVDRWADRMDSEELAAFCQWNNTPPKTFARVNTLKLTARDLAETWLHEGVDFAEGRFDWVEAGSVFELESFPSLASLESFQSGGFYLQDPSTLLAVRMLDPQPGEAILDLCAAPGGKTTYMAQLMNNTGRITAHDPAPGRLALVAENCARLGITCVTPCGDLGGAQPEYDRILVDAPCSNTGVLRRRVELRWRLEPTEFARLAAVQLELLESAAHRLKPGGVMVYSTCSLEADENAQVVAQFLRRHPEFSQDAEKALHPLRDGVDGAYVARLRGPSSSARPGSATSRPV
ncbi:MAG: 16S rRNA (cytosine(967)-C(5))-methyltransferase RsmB [Verrucomicrobia bacterium]|nr:16S rRNA (cytosine(967)-C(5))-methyltransferase RsmB [Verrucomicrobiota bacterium]